MFNDYLERTILALNIANTTTLLLSLKQHNPSYFLWVFLVMCFRLAQLKLFDTFKRKNKMNSTRW